MDSEKLNLYVRLTKEKRELESALRDTKEQLSGLETDLLEQFADDGVQNVRVNGMTVYLKKQTFASYDDPDRVCEALVKCGHSEMVKKAVNRNSLSALVREYLEEGGLPELLKDSVKVTEMFRLGAKQ